MLESVVKDRLNEQNCIQVWDREHLELEAKMAVEFAVKWGMVAAMPDGEDTAGRQKLRLATPAELVERSLNVARLMYEGVRARGLMHQAPSLQDVADADANRLDIARAVTALRVLAYSHDNEGNDLLDHANKDVRALVCSILKNN